MALVLLVAVVVVILKLKIVFVGGGDDGGCHSRLGLGGRLKRVCDQLFEIVANYLNIL